MIDVESYGRTQSINDRGQKRQLFLQAPLQNLGPSCYLKKTAKKVIQYQTEQESQQYIRLETDKKSSSRNCQSAIHANKNLISVDRHYESQYHQAKIQTEVNSPVRNE